MTDRAPTIEDDVRHAHWKRPDIVGVYDLRSRVWWVWRDGRWFGVPVRNVRGWMSPGDFWWSGGDPLPPPDLRRSRS